MQVYNSFNEMAAGTGALQQPNSQMSVFNAGVNSDWDTLLRWAAAKQAAGLSWQDIREKMIDKGISYEDADNFLSDNFPAYAKENWGIETDASSYAPDISGSSLASEPWYRGEEGEYWSNR